MSFAQQFDVDKAAEIIKIKLKIHEFLLQTKGFKKELDQSCICYHKTLQEKNKLQENFEAFTVIFNCQFNKIVDAEILYLITKEPKQFRILAEEIVYGLIKEFYEKADIAISIRSEQIYFKLRVHDLPFLPTYKFKLQAVHLNCALTTFNCIIYSKSPLVQYVQQSVWKCQKCIGAPCIIQKNREAGRRVETCEQCENKCEELKSHQTISNVCSIKGFDADLFKARGHTTPSVLFALDLKLYDDLCQDLTIGNEYIVTGLLNVFGAFYDVWNILASNI